MVSSTFILFPLYIYPSGTAWNSLFKQIAAQPSVNFSVIVNPASGPGDTAYPNTDYIPNIAKLNSYPSVQTLGYVDTNYTFRALSDVEADIDIYQGWSSYTGADIHIDGIFFDDATSSTESSNYTYMESIYDYVKTTLPADGNFVMFNPGVLVDSSYFDIADSIVVFEDYYSHYSSNTLSNIPQALRAQSTVIIHNMKNIATTQATVVQNLVQGGIGQVYITTTGGYTSFSALWSQFVASVAQYVTQV